jgi:hypothetical protein
VKKRLTIVLIGCLFMFPVLGHSQGHSGRNSSDKGIGPLYVEDLEMYPDPASVGQAIRFKIRLRNDGRPIRGHIQIQDRNQVVALVENATIPRGSAEYQFPPGRYTFQGSNTCFTVLVDFERTPYPVDASRKYCPYPVGWTLGPSAPCNQIIQICDNSGFDQNEAAGGTGLWRDCINPIMQGKTKAPGAKIPLPVVDPKLVDACKARNPQFGQGPVGSR